MPRPAPNAVRIRRAAEQLSTGGNTVVLVGSGLEGEKPRRALEDMADRMQAPIIVLPEGIHYLQEPPEYLTLRLTNRPDDPVRRLLEIAEQIILIGHMAAPLASFLAPSRRIVQISPDIRIVRPDPQRNCLVGCVPEILQELMSCMGPPGNQTMMERAREIAAADANNADQKAFWTALDNAIPKDSVLALEPGAIFDSAFFNLCIRDRTITSSFYHPSRGYGFLAAVAARLVNPARSAWGVTSHEGLREAMPDLLSARKHSIGVKTICLETDAEDHKSINFEQFAGACGFRVQRADNLASLTQAIKRSEGDSIPSMVLASRQALHSCKERIPWEITSVTMQPPEPSGNGVSSSFGSFMIESLHRAGIARVYGRIRPAMDCFVRRIQEDGRIKFVPVTHPESASMMASAYSKCTGRMGVVVAADERDTLFLLNGVYDAQFDRSPMLVITGHETIRGSLDSQRLFRAITRSSVYIQPDEHAAVLLGHSIEEALHHRTAAHVSVDWGRLCGPGPHVPFWFCPRSDREIFLPPAKLISEAARVLLGAMRPVVLVGRGARGAQDQIAEIASLLKAPIACTMPARGVIADHHPQFIGGVGASGHRPAIEAIHNCDVLLVLGSSNRGAVYGLTGKFLLIQIDCDPLQLGRRTQETLGLLGTIAETLNELIRSLKEEHAIQSSNGGSATPFRSRSRYLQKYRGRFEQWLSSQDHPGRFRESPIEPAAICVALTDVLRQWKTHRPLISVDVGVTTVWVYRHLLGDYDFLWTSSFGTMGFSLPAAIAAKEVDPSRPVIAIAGDGGIAITMSELVTAVRLNLPVVVIIVNNGKLAAIKYEQEVMGWPEYQAGLFNCNFAEYAKACGAEGFRVVNKADLRGAIHAALTSCKPCVVDVVCDPHAMPAPPKIHALQAAGYLLAVTRELKLRARGVFRKGVGAS